MRTHLLTLASLALGACASNAQSPETSAQAPEGKGPLIPDGPPPLMTKPLCPKGTTAIRDAFQDWPERHGKDRGHRSIEVHDGEDDSRDKGLLDRRAPLLLARETEPKGDVKPRTASTKKPRPPLARARSPSSSGAASAPTEPPTAPSKSASAAASAPLAPASTKGAF